MPLSYWESAAASGNVNVSRPFFPKENLKHVYTLPNRERERKTYLINTDDFLSISFSLTLQLFFFFFFFPRIRSCFVVACPRVTDSWPSHSGHEVVSVTSSSLSSSPVYISLGRVALALSLCRAYIPPS